MQHGFVNTLDNYFPIIHVHIGQQSHVNIIMQHLPCMVTDSDSKYIHPYIFDKDGNVHMHVSMIVFYGDIIYLSSRAKIRSQPQAWLGFVKEIGIIDCFCRLSRITDNSLIWCDNTELNTMYVYYRAQIENQFLTGKYSLLNAVVHPFLQESRLYQLKGIKTSIGLM